jgi:protein-tyrosine-phosphatase
MAFCKPKSIEDAVHYGNPEVVVSMGCEVACPVFPGATNQEWDLPDPSGKPIAFMRKVRDDIEERVKQLISEITASEQRATT